MLSKDIHLHAKPLAFSVLVTASVCHFLNDLMQSLFTASYPLFKEELNLSFTNIGMLTLGYQLSASVLQPLVGSYTDKRPQPYALAIGMTFTMAGLITMGYAPSYGVLMLGAVLLGTGSSIFHPEASRLTRLASTGAHGLGQSIFQVGGNAGSALGPLLVAYVVLAHGRGSLAGFALIAFIGMVFSFGLSRWYRESGHADPRSRARPLSTAAAAHNVSGAIAVLSVLMLSKFFYLASFTSYYTFYLMEHFSLPAKSAQLCLFAFLVAVAIGTLAGGPIGDRVGRKKVIWVSIFGIVPFALALPYVNLQATVVLSVIIGLVLASAFSAIVVYAQTLVPHRIGMISGLFFGLAFGLGGLGAALLGVLADSTSVEYVYKLCAYLPLLGALAAFLPNIESTGPGRSGTSVVTSPRSS
jgi:FSR family fosmidomycin resistance protein-like MFS transporter